MTDKATAVFGVLADWRVCLVCHQPAEQWPWNGFTFHPTCYLCHLFHNYPELYRAGLLDDDITFSLRMIVDDINGH